MENIFARQVIECSKKVLRVGQNRDERLSDGCHLAGFHELQQNRLLFWLILTYAIVWIGTAIKPYHRADWLLENLLVFASIPVLLALYRHSILSNISYLLLFIFFILHAIGAHFTYTNMPLGNWLRDGLSLSRNHYDRVVHFAFGLLLTYPFRDVLMRAAGLRGAWSYVLSVHVVIAWSAVYEILEGMAADLISPELGTAFNGIQGDIWDAQKDMSLAMVGAIIAMLLTAAVQIRTKMRFCNTHDLQREEIKNTLRHLIYAFNKNARQS